MTKPCGCCEGAQKLTPADLTDRPGMDAIAWRVGTYATFYETMLAQLSNASFGLDRNRARHIDVDPLKALTTRVPSDASIALLDAWAVVGDILTFYQERIANEGYLRTATERRSVLELARLVGYKLRPGVAASVRLAFTLQKDFRVVISEGTPVKSMPGPNELPRTFETSEAIAARAEWNEIAPRLTRPQRIEPANVSNLETIWLDGTATRLAPNDRLLIVFKTQDQRFVRKVEGVFEDHDKKRTKVALQTEEFTSVKFANAIQDALRQRIARCPELENVSVVKKLKSGAKAQATLADLSALVAPVLTELGGQGADLGKSQVELKALEEAAHGIVKALSVILDTNDAALSVLMTGAVDAYSKQDGHSKAVEAALKLLLDSLALATVEPRITAVQTADAALLNETEADAAFNLTELAKAIADLRTGWKVPLDNANAAILAACTSAIPLLKDTAALGTAADAALKTALDKTRTNLVKAVKPGVPPSDTAAQFDIALKQVSEATTAAADLAAKLGEILTALQTGLNGANAEFKKISTLLDLRADLQKPKASDAPRKQNLIDKVSQSLAKVKTASAQKLLDQSTSLAEAAGQIKIQSDAAVAAGATPFTLLHDRFEELRKALIALPSGRGPQIALLSALDSVAIPATAIETAFAGQLKALRDPVRTVLADITKTLGDSIGKTTEGAGALDLKATEIQKALQDSKDHSDCLADTVSLLTAIQLPFRNHFLSEARDTAERYIGQAVNLPDPAVQSAVVFLRPVSALDETSTLNDITKALTTAREAIVKIEPPRGAGGAPATAWFQGIERDLQIEIDELSTAAAVPDVPQDQSAFNRLDTIHDTLSIKGGRGAPAQLTLANLFSEGSDAVPQSLVALQPELGEALFEGWKNNAVEKEAPEVYAFRVKAAVFGYNSPGLLPVTTRTVDHTKQTFTVTPGGDFPKPTNSQALFLDAAYDQILHDSWILIQRPLLAAANSASFDPGRTRFISAKAGNPNAGLAQTQFGITGKTTYIGLVEPDAAEGWIVAADDFNIVRDTTVYAHSELLALAEAPIDCPVGSFRQDKFPGCEFAPGALELNGALDGLQPGRSVVVSGERIDVPGVLASEVADVAGVQQNIDQTLAKDSLHTKLILSTNLQYGYKRDTVKINANVAHATNGDSQKEVLGNGNGAQVFQTFKLNHRPLTFLSAPTPSGVNSTLQVRVNDLLWHEADTLADLGPKDRKFITFTDDDGVTYVEFGNGVQGSRLPSGSQNVRAVYRSEIGKGGNVAAGQISILASPPLGVTGVMNPIPATGGADPETRDSARRNAPLAVMSLDRLVSLADYESYARTYAGIAKASSTRLTDGFREFVHVTIAGLDDIPIDPDSDLFRNLLQSMRDFGDPHIAIEMARRNRLLLVLEAEIAVDPDYEWLPVKKNIRDALLHAFGYEQQELGEDVRLSGVLAVIQSVPGVLYSDVRAFDSIAEGDTAANIVSQFHPAKPGEAPAAVAGTGTALPPTLPAPHAKKRRKVQDRIFVELARMGAEHAEPAQIAYFAPEVVQTLILREASAR